MFTLFLFDQKIEPLRTIVTHGKITIELASGTISWESYINTTIYKSGSKMRWWWLIIAATLPAGVLNWDTSLVEKSCRIENNISINYHKEVLPTLLWKKDKIFK